jgi:hypothetical protein
MIAASGEGYLLQNPDVVAFVDATYPHAKVFPDGRWEATSDLPPPARDVPGLRGKTVVVYCANPAFYPGLIASLRSLLHFHPTVPVVIISWALSSRQEEYLSGFATVVPRRDELPDDPIWGQLGLFHLDVQRAVCLDADTIILQPIDDLFASKAPFAAARNLDWGIRENFKDTTVLSEFGLDPNLPAFNAGVYTVDVAFWGTRLYDELLELNQQYGYNFMLGDQSALHLAFYRSEYSFEWLPDEFNGMAEFWDWNGEPPRILHYAGPDKPWWPNYNLPGGEYFFRWSKIPKPDG